MDFLRALRSAVTHNFGLKLLALLLAVLIHVVVQRDSVREAVVDLPISIINVPNGQVLAGPVPEIAKARVRGRWGGIRELLSDRSARIVVDAGLHRSGGRFVFEQRAVAQQLATAHVEVLAVDPAWIDLHFEPLEHRSVPVEPMLAGEPAPGFRVTAASVHVDPAKVDVSGPASQVRKLLTVQTVSLDLAGTDHDVRTTVHLQVPPGRVVRIAPEEVTVDVRLDEQTVTRTLPPQPIVVRGCPEGSRCTVDPAEVELRIEGPARAASAFAAHPPDNIVYADLAGPLGRGEHVVRLGLNAVKGLTLTPAPAVAKFVVVGENPPQP